MRWSVRCFMFFWIMLLAGSFSLVPEVIASVTWEKMYDGGNVDRGGPVLPTGDGGYIAMGRTLSFGQDMETWLLKLSPVGVPQWQKVYGNTGYNWANDLQATSDGGYVVAGGGFTMKISPIGDIEWQKRLVVPGRSCDGIAVRETSDGGFVVLAKVTISGYSSDYERQDFWLVKLDADGDIEWQKLFDKQQHDFARGLQIVSDGGYILTGISYRNYGNVDVWILKLDSQGEIEWQNLYGGSLRDFPYAVLESDDGGFMVAGTSPLPYPVWEYPWVMKLGVDGEILWQRKYDQLREVRSGLTMIRANNGGFMLAGAQTGGHIFLLEIDSLGKPVWLNSDYSRGSLESINKTKDNGYIMSRYNGHYYSWQGDNYISKVDPLANSCFGQVGHYSTSQVENDFQLVSSPVSVQNVEGYVTELNFVARDTNIIPKSFCVSALPEIFIDSNALSYGFGSVNAGETSIEQVLVANEGGTDLEISAVTISGPDAGQFQVSTTCAGIIPGASCMISVTFSPTSLGAKIAILNIASNDPDQPSIEIPLAGQGVDTRPPVITLDGEANVTVEAGTAYVDSGATAFDAVDGDLTASIAMVNPVNASVVGTYTVTYNVVDKAGNRASEVTRTVQVVDTIPPAVSLSVDRTFLWPPNRKLVEVQVAGGAADSGSGVASVEIRVVDEYGKYDMSVPGLRSTVALEAWREGGDADGRVYTLSAVVTDNAGNTSCASTQVLVPHDMGK